MEYNLHTTSMESIGMATNDLEKKVLEIASSSKIQGILLCQGEEQENVYREIILSLINPDTPTFENTKRTIITLIGIVGESDNQDTRDCAIAILSSILGDFPHQISIESKRARTKIAGRKPSLKLIMSTVYKAYIDTLEKQHTKDNVDPYGEIASLLMIAPLLILNLPLTPDQLTKLEASLFYLRYIPYRLSLDPYRRAGKYIKDTVSGLGIETIAQARRKIMGRKDCRSKR